MPNASEIITKPSVITEFIQRVMDPARNTVRWSSTNYPQFDHRVWENGGIIFWGNLPSINTAPLADSNSNVTSPTNAELSSLVLANEILNLLRNYAYNTTVIRRIRYGKYYSIYSHNSGARTGVPADDYVPFGYTGTFLNGTWPTATGTPDGEVGFAHMTSAYLVSNPLSVAGPVVTTIIDGSDLTDFFTNLRNAADATTNGSAEVDLRICHSSCHNNCHSSRGRR